MVEHVTPPAVRQAIEAVQVARVRRHLPLLHLVGIVNTLIVVAVAYTDGLPMSAFLLPLVLIALSGTRLAYLVVSSRRPVEPTDRVRYLSNVGRVAIVTVSLAAIWCIWIYVQSDISHRSMIPVSIALGSFCIAYCLSPLSRTAMAVLGIGVTPSAVAIFFTGDLLYSAIFIAIVSAALLQIRLIAEQYEHLVAALGAEMQMRRQAETDELTGLANRRAFVAAAAAAIDGGEPFAVALLDLDGFKRVNDQLGHAVGDQFLQIVAERIATSAGQGDVAARLGGDEFVVLIAGEFDDLETRCTSLLDQLCVPCTIDETTLPVAATVGVSRFPDDGQSVSTLLATADSALYSAKRAGKRRVRFHEPAVVRRVA